MLPNVDLCRICAQKKKVKHPIFEIGENFPDMIHDCLNLNISLTDTLPKVICCECQKCIEHFWAFKEKCFDAQVLLTELSQSPASNFRNRLAAIKQELEPSEESIVSSNNLDHTYNMPSYHPPVRIVKTEVCDDLPHEEESINDDFIIETLEIDVKQPEIVNLADDESITPNRLFQENKPIFEDQLEDNMVLEDTFWVEESDLKEPKEITRLNFSNEGEIIDIDMEEMEATIKKAKNPNMRFRCQKCKKSFKFYKGFKKHKALHETTDTIYNCHFCLEETQTEFQFATLTTLKRHLLTQHLQEGKYQCKLCLKHFQTKSLHILHLSRDHNIKRNTCCICSKTFSNESSLNSHMRIHDGRKPYSCNKCVKKFKWLSSFERHLQSHNNQKDFLCSQCGLKLSSRTALVEHFNIHSGEKPFACSRCGFTFSHKAALIRHEALHNRPIYKCVPCDRSFSNPGGLRGHQLTHTNEPTITCKICNKQFQRYTSYWKHSLLHQPKTFKCNNCEYTCHRSDTLKSHMSKHTGVKHVCPASQCTRSYTQRTGFVRHFKKEHPELELLHRIATNDSILYNFALRQLP